MKRRVHRRFFSGLKVPERIDFIRLIYDEDGYRVYVSEFGEDAYPVVEINFGFSVVAQRSMDEGSFLSLEASVDEGEGAVGPIVVVTGSDFLDWFVEESCGVYQSDEIKHVAVLTQNEWVEVLCLDLPILRMVNG